MFVIAQISDISLVTAKEENKMGLKGGTEFLKAKLYKVDHICNFTARIYKNN